MSVVCLCTAGVVVSCKIPILATRVRFPGSALFYIKVKVSTNKIKVTVYTVGNIVANLI